MKNCCAGNCLSFALVRLREIEQRADGNDARWINLTVRDVVVTFDVIKVDSIGDAWLLIQVHQVSLQVGIIENASQVAFEVAVINRVETHERAEQSPVCFDNTVAK